MKDYTVTEMEGSRKSSCNGMCQTSSQTVCTCAPLMALGRTYSLIPQLTSFDDVGTGKRNDEGSFSFASGSVTDGYTLKLRNASLPNVKSKPKFMDRVFGGISKGSKSPELDHIGRFSSPGDNPIAQLRRGSDCPQICDTTDHISSAPFTSPASYIQPLKHKMEPRVEPGRLPKQAIGREPGPVVVFKETIWYPLDRPAKDRTRLEIIEVMPSPEPPENELLDLSEEEFLRSSTPAAVPEHSLDERIQFMLDHEIKDLADLWKTDPATKTAWSVYLTNYTQGKFNLTYPPLPPSSNSNFTYLPALLSFSEIDRAAQASAFDIIWPTWKQNEGPTELLLGSVLRTFEVPLASMSFFDEKYELIQTSSWYPEGKILRKRSLAAHALMTADVLVVPDTHKDWRFLAHPFVVGGAHIRFFACAPLLSKAGLPVGVLSIWDSKPREMWTPQQRAELAHFCTAIMANLESEVDRLRGPAMRFTPLLERDSNINADYWAHNRPSHLSDVDVDPLFCVKDLRINKSTSIQKTHPDSQVERDLTPPSSASSNQRFVNPNAGCGKNHMELRVDSSINIYPAVAEMITPDSKKFGSLSSPRPYSGSDITSVHGDPPNTPHASLISWRFPQPPYEQSLQHLKHRDLTDLTVDDFHSLSYDDVAEDPNFNSGDTPLTTATTTHGSIDISAIPWLQHGCLAASMTPETTVLSVQPEPNSMPNVMKQWAENLGYDRMYVLSMKATDRKVIDEAVLFAPGGMTSRIVAAYGLYETLDPNIPLHFRTIRSRGVTVYEEATEIYAHGLLIAIQTQGGPVQIRNSGLVLAAFRKNPTDESFKVHEEHCRFEQAAKDIGAILLGEKRDSLLATRRDNTGLVNSKRYPANEAVEVGLSAKEIGRNRTRQVMSQRSVRQGDHRAQTSKDTNETAQIDFSADIGVNNYRQIRSSSRQKNINSNNSLAFATLGPEFHSRQLTADMDS